MRIVATAGHVDHGKSTLVQALTGTHPDRWAVERERALTIDLGFAAMDLPSGPVAFVDVPGHERYLGNMLAGVGAVDAVLLVVSAVEGWKAQSEEHLTILEVLGIAAGVVALTHADRVGPDRRAEVEAQVRARLGDGPLGDVEVIATAVPTGRGLEDLVGALDRMVRSTLAPADGGRPRLWLDRAFTIRGRGTVVTGTLTGGSLSVGQALVTTPGGRLSRIRTIQVHGQSRGTAGPGHRVALNVPDLTLADVGRGVALVEPGRWHPTTTLDATLDVFADAPRPVGRRGAHLLHTGSGSWAIGIQVLPRGAIEPGTSGEVRLHLPEPLALRPGDRYVLRDAGADLTVGGGTVLDLDPLLPPRRARPNQRWQRVVAEHGWIDTALLERLTGVGMAPTIGPWVVSSEALDRSVEALRCDLRAAGPSGIDISSLDPRTGALVRSGLVADAVCNTGRAWLADHDRALVDHLWLVRLVAEPFGPRPLDAVPAEEVEALVRRRLVFVSEGIHFPREAIAGAMARLGEVASANPQGFTVSQARVALGTTRRFALALLHELEARGLVRRDGDRRTVVAEPSIGCPGVGAVT